MWQLLSRLLATYERLYDEEQVFLLEVRGGRGGGEGGEGRGGGWGGWAVEPVYNVHV